MISTHICPTCSKPCIYKNGIMCTIVGCVNDGTARGQYSKNGINVSSDDELETLRRLFKMGNPFNFKDTKQ